MIIMKIKTLAPLIIDYCISYLKEKEVGTKYRPGKFKFMLDSKVMARIIWHNGNMQATTTQDETVLMTNFIKSVQEQGIIESITTNNKYKITTKENHNKPAIYIERIFKFNFKNNEQNVINALTKGEKTNG